MKTTAYQIYIVLAIFSLATLSCGLFARDKDAEPAEESAAPQALAEEDAPAIDLGDEYRSVEGGYAFNVIPGYKLEEAFGLVSMQESGADPDVGPFLMLIGGSNDEGKSNSQLLDDFVSGLDENSEVFDRQDVHIDGLPGITVDFKGLPDGKEAVGRAAFVAVNPTQMFSLFVVAPPELWDDELESSFEAVLGTITFFEPEEI